MATVAAATVAVVSAPPALAYEDIEIGGPGEPGVMWFHDDGDVFTVCDLERDYGGVVGKLYYKPLGGDWYVTDAEGDGGDAGCDKFASDVNNVGDYRMTLFWGGLVVAESRVFNE